MRRLRDKIKVNSLKITKNNKIELIHFLDLDFQKTNKI